MLKTRLTLAVTAAFVFLSAFPFAATAQNQQNQQNQQGGNRRGGFDPAQMINRRIETFKRELSITADQEKKIRAILEEGMKSITPPARGGNNAGTGNTASGGTNGGATQNSRRDRLVNDRNTQNAQANSQNIFEQMNAKIKKVLTAEQAKKFDALPRGGGRGMGGGGQMDPAAMVQRRLDSIEKNLGLAADQKAKIKTILEKSGENMRQTMQQQQGNQDREAMRAAFQKLREQENKEIEAVLKPDQVKKLREEQANRMRGRGQNNQNN